MTESHFFQRRSFGISHGLLILMIVFFFVPFSLRGARMAVNRTENNVKDWLPDSFRETEELAWFAGHFVSEQFVLATWPDCNASDQRYRMLVDKLRHESATGLAQMPEEQAEYRRARQLGDELKLFYSGDYHQNWGGQDERWLIDQDGQWFYITPDGKLFRWDGKANLVNYAQRRLQRAMGRYELRGQLITQLGPPPNERYQNPFYSDPMRVTAPLFKDVQTGPQLVAQLAGPGGPLHRPGQIEGSRRDAIARLTGTLFAPPVPAGFGWSVAEMQSWLPADKLSQLPTGWEGKLDLLVERRLQKEYAGDRQALAAAAPDEQMELWYSFFDAVAVDPPERQTALLVTLTPSGQENLKRVLGRGVLGFPQGRLLQLAEESGLSAPAIPTLLPPPFSWLVEAPPVREPAIRMGGPPVDNVAIDEEGTITLVRLVGYSIVLGLLLSYICMRSIKLTLMVFFVGGVAAATSLSLVWWWRSSVDAVLLTMPSLVYVLGMSGAIHVINYFKDASAKHGQSGAAEMAVSHALIPCTLAAVTTAIGLGSLATSNILPIRKFGIFSAMGVVATLLLIFLYLPSALTVFPPRLRRGKSRSAPKLPLVSDPRADLVPHNWVEAAWLRVGNWVIRRYVLVGTASLLAMVVCGAGLLKIQTNVQLLKLFDSGSQIIRDYGWLEENFGRLVPMELVVRFPKPLQQDVAAVGDTSQPQVSRRATPPMRLISAIGPAAEAVATDTLLPSTRSRLSLLERAEAVARIQKTVEEQFGYHGQDVVGRGMSAVTLLRDIPEPTRRYSPQRRAYDLLLQNAYPQLLTTDYLRLETDPEAVGTELWRISLRLGALNNVDYGQFVSQIRLAVEPVVAAYNCRTEVLQLVEQFTEAESRQLTGVDAAAAGERPRARVLVLGAASPARRLEAAEQSAAAVTGGPYKDSGGKAAVDGSRIFLETLAHCLENESIERRVWHDPEQTPIGGADMPLEQWNSILARCACIVLVGDHASYDLEGIRSINPRLVDMRQTLGLIEQEAGRDRVASGRSVAHSPSPSEVDVIYTGVVPIVYKAQRTLLESLIVSIAWAFVLIGVVISGVLLPYRRPLANLHPKSWTQAGSAGFLAMAPNVFPVVIIFGLMGHGGVAVDIGTMMTASVAMGVAVDDSIHFLAWFRDGLRDGLTQREAVLKAYRRVGPAMTQTTIIAGLGLSIFALSTFTPTQRFGTLMLTLLSAALIGDLLFLPAILASPLGRLFMPKDITSEGDSSHHRTPAEEGEAAAATHDHSAVGKSEAWSAPQTGPTPRATEPLLEPRLHRTDAGLTGGPQGIHPPQRGLRNSFASHDRPHYG